MLQSGQVEYFYETLVGYNTRTNMSGDGKGKTILVTGGGGYIGSHCVHELLVEDYDVVAIDNFANSVPGKYDFEMM